MWPNIVSCPAFFLHVEGKNSLVNSLFRFCSMRFKTCWRNMYYVMSHMLRNYETVSKRQLIAGIILLGASEYQEMKIHKTWSLFRPQKALRRSYRHLKLMNFTLPVGKLRNTYYTFMEVLLFLRWSVLWFCLLYNASTAKQSLVAIYCSTWRHFHEAIWLECH